MRDLKEASVKMEELLRAAGIEKYALKVSESEKRELNTENGAFVLFRTIFDANAQASAFAGSKKGSAEGNDLSDEGLAKLITEACASAESAEDDDANDIAPDQGIHSFEEGPAEPDMERFYERLEEMSRQIGEQFPKVLVMQMIASHDKVHTLYRNSNGTEFDTKESYYEVTLEFSAFEGERGTGLSYTSFSTRDLDKPFLEMGDVRKQLEDAEASLIEASIGGKFEGKVILTPAAMAMFAYMLGENYMGATRVLSGESMWLNKIGEKVASEKLTVSLAAEDPRLVRTHHFTDDGFSAENVKLIENGVLKSHMLNLYVAKKTGRPVTMNSSYNVVIEPGETPYADMLAKLDKGLIVGGFSGGEPGANGEFSGVAKNSFYVENGKIQGAVSEVMISGNLESLFVNLIDLSSELLSDGSMAAPYMMTDGVVISGQ